MYENLMEEVVSAENYGKALRAVIANKGAPGIDGMTTEELNGHLLKHYPKIHSKLMAGTYVPTPVRRKDIDKQGGGKRKLGIPTVLDRFIQQMLLQAMTPIWEPRFSEHSYGFRPGRKAADAVRAAQGYSREGLDWVVDIDITKFFDHVNWDILMGRIGAVIRDKRVLKLIGRYLRAGAMEDGVVVKSVEGTPQGGPLTPRTQKITSNLSGGCGSGGNRVRIETCRTRLYIYDKCRAPAISRRPSASIVRGTCFGSSSTFPTQPHAWRRTAPFRRVKPTVTSNKLSD
jgi:RNA-directed DNA polymerase